MHLLLPVSVTRFREAAGRVMNEAWTPSELSKQYFVLAFNEPKALAHLKLSSVVLVTMRSSQSLSNCFDGAFCRLIQPYQLALIQ